MTVNEKPSRRRAKRKPRPLLPSETGARRITVMSHKHGRRLVQVTSIDIAAAKSHITILTGESNPVMNFRLVPESAAAWEKLNALPPEERRCFRMKYRGTI